MRRENLPLPDGLSLLRQPISRLHSVSGRGEDRPMEAMRSRLLATAHQYTDSLRSQPGLAGIVLYGSLSSGEPPELTPFSDVDLVLILNHELPPQSIEHRLVDGIKVDVIYLPIDAVRDLAARQPERLYQGGWLLQFLMKSFLLGSEETILFDPTGEIAFIRHKLREMTTYSQMLLPDASRWFQYAENECLAPASERLEQGDFRAAAEKCGHALWILCDIAQALAATKSLERAAERLRVPRFAVTAGQLRQMLAPAASAVQAYRHAAQALWDETYRRVFEPIRAELARAGVAQPDQLELTGDYPLFWPGNRIHELGRLVAEVNLSFTWCGWEQERGNLPRSLSLLWACDSDHALRRCEGLAAALKDAGHDVSGIVQPVLESPAIRRLAAAVDEAGTQAQIRDFSPAHAEKALQLAQELLQTMADSLAGPTGVPALD